MDNVLKDHRCPAAQPKTFWMAQECWLSLSRNDLLSVSGDYLLLMARDFTFSCSCGDTLLTYPMAPGVAVTYAMTAASE